jgi:hypothetical protein
MVTKGNYSDYLAAKVAVQSNRNGTSQEVVQKAKLSREQTKIAERVARQRAKQITEIENSISLAETRLNQIAQEVEIASQAQDIAKLQKLGNDYQTTEAKLDELLTQWTELELN